LGGTRIVPDDKKILPAQGFADWCIWRATLAREASRKENIRGIGACDYHLSGV
jgi:hypothetical protein